MTLCGKVDRLLLRGSYSKTAVNRVSITHSRSPPLLQINGREIPAEAYLQRRAQNSNVINIYQVIDTDEYFVYVVERPETCKDMFDIIAERYDQNRTLTEREVRRYFTQILQANIGCEKNGVLHRDIKPENILVDMSSDVAKLIDFGLASEVQQEPFRKFRGEHSEIPLWSVSCTITCIIVFITKCTTLIGSPRAYGICYVIGHLRTPRARASIRCTEMGSFSCLSTVSNTDKIYPEGLLEKSPLSLCDFSHFVISTINW